MSTSFDNRQYPQWVQDRADTLGISPGQYMQISENIDQASPSFIGNQAWNTVPGSQQANQYQNVAKFLRASQAAGGQQTPTQGPTTPQYVAQNPLYDMTNLGAAALGEQAVYNAMPGPADKKTGVGTVTQPQMTAGIPTVPYGPWSNVAGVFGKKGAQAPPPNSPALDTIGSKMTPAQFSDVANQIRSGSTSYVTVNGKPYTISGANIQKITQAFPSQQPQQQTTGQPPATTPLTPTRPATAVGGGQTAANTAPLDFGRQVANTAIQNEIQRQMNLPGNLYASTAPGVPGGWQPSTTTTTPATPTTPATITRSPSEPRTALAYPTPTADQGMNVGQFMGQNAAQAGVSPAAWQNKAATALGTQTTPATAIGNAGAAVAQSAKNWQQGILNTIKPIQSAIPGPDEFMNRYTTPTLVAR